MQCAVLMKLLNVPEIDRSSILQRWVISIYYIFQAILTVGFGEIVTLQKEELQFLIVITIIGKFFSYISLRSED